MKKFFSLTLTLAAMLSAMAVSAQAADYSFETDGTPEYYPSSSYEDVYGSRYNYGGKNVVDYQIPELEYGQTLYRVSAVLRRKAARSRLNHWEDRKSTRLNSSH